MPAEPLSRQTHCRNGSTACPRRNSQNYSPLLGSILHVLRTRNCLVLASLDGVTSTCSLKMFSSSPSSDRSSLLNESGLGRGVMGKRRLLRRSQTEFSGDDCTEFSALAKIFASPSRRS
ncbi:hypothetical protein Y032_0320g2392 [Ancylostoma ceylanicum]|uniref:Uncharacterized protein n=1 Tax=Ancylostoma ceylanicum TaxID=53326 RepID=A0A016S1P1_9BILA|nr:hypothetical protein Y032_0320g2392 [Ancylostoma ceylanicum]